MSQRFPYDIETRFRNRLIASQNSANIMYAQIFYSSSFKNSFPSSFNPNYGLEILKIEGRKGYAPKKKNKSEAMKNGYHEIILFDR